MLNYGADFLDTVAAELQEASEPEARIVIRVFRVQDVIKLLPLLERSHLPEVCISFDECGFLDNSLLMILC
jgi:hypothetical protein